LLKGVEREFRAHFAARLARLVRLLIVIEHRPEILAVDTLAADAANKESVLLTLRF